MRTLAATNHLPDYVVTFDSGTDMVTFQNRGTMKLAAAAFALVLVFGGPLFPASAQTPALGAVPFSPPFTSTLSNNLPLAIGMDSEDVTRALGTPLVHVSGPPGDEILMAFRNVGGSQLFYRKDRLYLQFRNGRLAGWKGDWGHNWMWQ